MADPKIEFNQSALKALVTGSDIARFVGAMGQEVADRANAKAETLFTDQGGGGVGSLESHIEHDGQGYVVARIAYPPEHFYMWFGEIGTSHQRARPHVRPALFATRRASGGKESAIKSIRQDKATQAKTKASRRKR